MKDGLSDERWMARSIELAKRGRFTADPNPLVGAVLVKSGRMLNEGFHLQAGGLHAERVCLQGLSVEQTRGATLYVTLEPCCHQGRTPPCVDAIIQSRVASVVIAHRDPNPQVSGRGCEQLRSAGIEVTEGVLAEQAKALNPGFIKRMKTGLPWVQLKIAASLDGRSAMASGESQWITGELARQDVQYQRASASVIVSGIRSVIQDGSRLTVRTKQWSRLDSGGARYPVVQQPFIDGQHQFRQPVRLILDKRLDMPEDHPMLNQPGETWLLCDKMQVEKRRFKFESLVFERLKRAGKLRIHAFETDERGCFALRAVMQWLGRQGFNQVWVEAGANLLGSFLQTECWDELIVYTAPKLLGHTAAPLVSLPVETLSEAKTLTLKSIETLAPDLKTTWYPGSELK